MDEVDQEALDVTAIVVLISHDHDLSIAQRGQHVFCVLFAHLQSDNLYDVLDLRVLTDLLGISISYIEQLTFERETAIVIAADDFDARQGQLLS